MRIYSGDGIGDIYYDLIRDITEHGRKIVTRGHECLELPGLVILEYQVPGACWMRIPGRKFNPFFALAEIPWILSGNGNVEWISYFNSNMRSFSDGDENFHGSYGRRIRKWYSATRDSETDQILAVVKKLKADPFSRQAIISLWDPFLDNAYESKDIPCNNHICYTLRDGKLHQTVTIRSNDVVWGTPHNAVQFTHLHAYVAGLLGVKMGLFTYVIHNLHYYLNQYKPTLSNLIDRAYDVVSPYHKLTAEVLEGFTTFGDSELHRMVQAVDDTKAFYEKGTGSFGASQGVYTDRIADTIKLFIIAKSGKLPGLAFEIMADLPELMRELIIDFCEGSSILTLRRISEHLRRNNDVCP